MEINHLDLSDITEDTVTLDATKEEVKQLEHSLEEVNEVIEGTESYLNDLHNNTLLARSSNKLTRLLKRFNKHNHEMVTGIMDNSQLENSIIAHTILKDGNELKEEIEDQLSTKESIANELFVEVGDSYSNGFNKVLNNFKYFKEMIDFNVLKTIEEETPQEEIDNLAYITKDENIESIKRYFDSSEQLLLLLSNRIYNNAPILKLEDDRIINQYLDALKDTLHYFRSDALKLKEIVSEDKIDDISTHEFNVNHLDNVKIYREEYKKSFVNRNEYVTFIDKLESLFLYLKEKCDKQRSDLDYLESQNVTHDKNYLAYKNIVKFNYELFGLILGDYTFVCKELNDKIEVLNNE